MNASLAVSENCVRLAATKASASEQMASDHRQPGQGEHAEQAAAGDAVEHRARHERLQRRGRGGADDEEAAGVEEVVLGRLDERAEARRRPRARCARALATHSSRPLAIHTKPTTHAASRLATKRATTISGRPGNATAVATSTTGFTAGADEQERHRRRRCHAAGHQPPGDRHRAALAARAGPRRPPRRPGRRATGRLGSSVASADGGT